MGAGMTDHLKGPVDGVAAEILSNYLLKYFIETTRFPDDDGDRSTIIHKFAIVTKKLVRWIHSLINCALPLTVVT